MTANDLTTQLLPLLVQGRPQVSFARDPLEGGKGLGGGANNFKGRWFNLPLGDSLLRGGRLLRDRLPCVDGTICGTNL